MPIRIARASGLPVEADAPPLIVHVIHRLSMGGMENGLINLINHMDPTRYRHAIISLTESTDFRERLQRPAVPVLSLHKRPGNDLRVYARLWQVLRRLRPAIVHTRNLAALEHLVIAALAGTPGRIHGEHGRDIYDLDGTNVKYNLLRKAVKPCVHRYIAVSVDLADWLVQTIGVRPTRVTQIYNGVDTQRFFPRMGTRQPVGPAGFITPNSFVVGTIGRMQHVKDQITLAQAFLHVLATESDAAQSWRLLMIGDGPLREEARQLLRGAGVEHIAWLPGERHDIPALFRALDVFALPSLREGIANTILEAMASGLPVVATHVGGNPEIVQENLNGQLVPSSNPVALAEAMRRYYHDRDLLSRHGAAGLQRVQDSFSMDAMVNGYLAVYDAVLQRAHNTRHSHVVHATPR